MEKIPLFDCFNMKGWYNDAKDIYNEVVQWGRSEREDKSDLSSYIYNMGYDCCDMVYMGWTGDELYAERKKYRALEHAYLVFLSTLEDLIGIKTEYNEEDLNEKGEIRYQIIDTKKENK